MASGLIGARAGAGRDGAGGFGNRACATAFTRNPMASAIPMPMVNTVTRLWSATPATGMSAMATTWKTVKGLGMPAPP